MLMGDYKGHDFLCQYTLQSPNRFRAPPKSGYFLTLNPINPSLANWVFVEDMTNLEKLTGIRLSFAMPRALVIFLPKRAGTCSEFSTQNRMRFRI